MTTAPKPKQETLKFADPDVEFVNITPEMAFKWIGRNLKNRPIKDSIINRYCADMRNGQWEINGESIKFDINDRLIDGQHRLHAIHRSGETVRMPVFTGLDPKVFHTLDIGRQRNAPDVLYVRGELNVNLLSAVLRLLYVYDHQEGDFSSSEWRRKSSISIVAIEDTLDRHPDIRHSVAAITDLAHSKFVTGSVVATVHYLFNKANPKKAGIFFEGLQSGAGLEADNPILVLRNTLMEQRDFKQRQRQAFVLALIIKAWNAFVKDEKIRTLNFKPGENFPDIIGILKS